MTCKRCDYLASEVMRLREDRNEWRAVAVWFAAGCALALQIFPARLSNDASKPDSVPRSGHHGRSPQARG